MRNYTVCPEWIYEMTLPVPLISGTKLNESTTRGVVVPYSMQGTKRNMILNINFCTLQKYFCWFFCHTFLINITTRGLCSLHFTKKKGKQKGMRLRNHNIIAYLIHPTLVPLPHHTSNFSTSSHHTHAPPSPPPQAHWF